MALADFCNLLGAKRDSHPYYDPADAGFLRFYQSSLLGIMVAKFLGKLVLRSFRAFLDPNLPLIPQFLVSTPCD